jgi:hypothetical protein
MAGCKSDSRQQDVEAEFAFVGVNVVDVETGQIQPEQTVLIHQEKIVAVAPFSSLNISSRTRTVFATGKYLLPGLMDSHVHAFADPDTAINKTLPLFVANGITHIRDTGSSLANLAEVETRLTNNPLLPHPHYFSTGPLLDGYKLPWYRDLQTVIDSPDQVPDIVTELQASEIRQLKVYSNLSPEVYRALAAETEKRNLNFAGHLPRDVSIHEAAQYRQLTIEHLDVSSTVSCAPQGKDWFADHLKAKFSKNPRDYLSFMVDYWQVLDWQICEPAWQVYKNSGGYLTPTVVLETADRGLVPEAALGFLDPGAREWCEQGLDRMEAYPTLKTDFLSSLKSALNHIHQTQTPLLAGSDTPNNCLVPGFSLHWELQRLHEFGLSPLETLQTATVNPDRAFSDAPRLIEAGHEASLVLLRDNPLESVTALQAIDGVYLKGRWYDLDALKLLKQQALAFAEQRRAEHAQATAKETEQTPPDAIPEN